MARLTDSAIEKLGPRPNGKEKIERDSVVRGLVLRIGQRRKSWGLRIERAGRPTVYRTLGQYPDLRVETARAKALDVLARFERREPLDERKRSEATIASILPLYLQKLDDDGASEWTKGWYKTAANRLSERIRNMPLRELAADPILVADEIEVIRADRRKKGTRAGASAATSTARFIRTMFTFAQRRDPTLVGNPAAAVRSVDPKRHDLPILHRADMPEWWDKVSKVKNDVERWALVFALLSGLRRDSLVKLRWEDVRTPILKARALRVRSPKGGEERAFDLILSRPMLAVLMRVRAAGRRLYPEAAKTWIFPGRNGPTRGDHLTKLGVASNHALRRAYASEGRAAGVPKDSIRRLLNHAGGDVTDTYIRNTALGALHLAEQETISAHLVRALGSPRELRST